MAEIERRLTEGASLITVDLAASEGAALSWLYAQGAVLARRDEGGRIRVDVRLTQDERGRFEKLFGRAAQSQEAAAAE